MGVPCSQKDLSGKDLNEQSGELGAREGQSNHDGDEWSGGELGNREGADWS